MQLRKCGCTRFKSVDSEELRGLKFHQYLLGKESVLVGIWQNTQRMLLSGPSCQVAAKSWCSQERETFKNCMTELGLWSSTSFSTQRSLLHEVISGKVTRANAMERDLEVKCRGLQYPGIVPGIVPEFHTSQAL